DNIGELTDKTDFAGQRTTYSYNRAGWRTGETWVSGSYTATYTYDKAGELTAAADPNSSYSYAYYNDGSLNTSRVSYPGNGSMGNVTLTYSYDGFGDVQTLSDSAGGVITYTYNGNHHLTALDFSGSSAVANLSFNYDAKYDTLHQTVMTAGPG